MGRRGLKGKLLEKSIEAYILSLETINRLSIGYRIETFSFLICNSWELLLKAKILDDNNNKRSLIFYKNTGRKKRSLSLADCLTKIFSNLNDPVRRNIEMLSELRDESVHLVIDKVPEEVLSLFQASVINYHNCLEEWFNVTLSERVTVGMMTVIYDFQPENFDFSSPAIKRKVGAETADYLLNYQARLRKEFNDLGKVSAFSIPIDYKLKLIKSGKPDIELISGKGGQKVGVIEVPKDPGKTHPFRQKDIIEFINNENLIGKEVNRYDFQCVLKVFSVKRNAIYYYQGIVQGSPSQYSQEFIDWLIKECRKNPDFFERARQTYTEIRKSGAA